jgi:hypothetical protein
LHFKRAGTTTEGVKVRPNAALALVLWYLMVPPSKGSPTFLFDAQARLDQWTVRDTFDRAAECRQQARTTTNLFKAFAKKDGTVSAINNSKRFAMAICLETDDPRLKGGGMRLRHAAAP